MSSGGILSVLCWWRDVVIDRDRSLAIIFGELAHHHESKSATMIAGSRIRIEATATILAACAATIKLAAAAAV
jgi:hypothetical protein